jgi:hypothetical protein
MGSDTDVRNGALRERTFAARRTDKQYWLVEGSVNRGGVLSIPRGVTSQMTITLPSNVTPLPLHSSEALLRNLKVSDPVFDPKASYPCYRWCYSVTVVV